MNNEIGLGSFCKKIMHLLTLLEIGEPPGLRGRMFEIKRKMKRYLVPFPPWSNLKCLTEAHQSFIEQSLEEWLKFGVVKRANSLYNSPIFCVTKNKTFTNSQQPLLHFIQTVRVRVNQWLYFLLSATYFPLLSTSAFRPNYDIKVWELR